MTEFDKGKKRRDANFKKLCTWLSDAEKIIDIVNEEFPAWKNSKEMQSALALINFMGVLFQFPQDYEGVPDDQANAYPDCARMLMLLAQKAGEAKQNDEGQL